MIFCYFYSKIVELEEELRVVGNNLKSLEVSEEKVCVEKLYRIIIIFTIKIIFPNYSKLPKNTNPLK